jgi:RTX calcium-binding nonapeptide repeat (4 copies)
MAGVVESPAKKRKGKGLVRRTMLFLGAMMVMLVVAGGVAFANTYCGDTFTCQCQDPGGLCVGTPEVDNIYGTDTAYGDKIYAKDGDDQAHAGGGGDYVDAGPGNDFISGDDVSNSGNDTLIGGDGDDEIYGEGGYDECYGGPGTDYLDPDTCEKRVP